MCLVTVQVNVLSAINCFTAKFLQLSVNNPQERLTLKQQRQMTSEMEKDESMATEAYLAPVTTQRKIRNNLEDSLSKPCKLFFYFQQNIGISVSMT